MPCNSIVINGIGGINNIINPMSSNCAMTHMNVCKEVTNIMILCVPTNERILIIVTMFLICIPMFEITRNYRFILIDCGS